MEADSLTWTVFSPGTGTWRRTHLLELFFTPGTGTWEAYPLTWTVFYSRYWYLEGIPTYLNCFLLQVLVLGRHTHLLELFFLQVLVHGRWTYLNCFFSRYWYMEADPLTWTVFSPGTGTWRHTHLLELFFTPGTGTWRQVHVLVPAEGNSASKWVCLHVPVPGEKTVQVSESASMYQYVEDCTVHVSGSISSVTVPGETALLPVGGSASMKASTLSSSHRVSWYYKISEPEIEDFTFEIKQLCTSVWSYFVAG